MLLKILIGNLWVLYGEVLGLWGLGLPYGGGGNGGEMGRKSQGGKLYEKEDREDER